jgi:hypothetical protein
MSLWLGIVIVLVANAVAVVVMLLVRRRAPNGGYYEDMQQAGWVYSVAGTSFAVILAFVFLLTFQSFDRARTSSSSEADSVLSLFHIADQFPAAERDALKGDLVCYGRSVVNLEWQTLDGGHQSPVTRDWALALDRDFNNGDGSGDERVAAAYSAWYDQTDQRQAGRQGRVDEAAPFVPALVWVFLLTGGALVVAFVWLFADPAERTFAQAALPVGVTTVVAAGLVLVAFFDAPYRDTPGAVRPTSMERQLRVMTAELGPGVPVPCDALGRPT